MLGGTRFAIVEAREDVEGVPYDVTGPKAELHKLLEDVAGVALSVQPFSDPELDAGANLEVVARIGVGYDAVDVPALTRRNLPLMIAGTANSVSVAHEMTTVADGEFVEVAHRQSVP